MELYVIRHGQTIVNKLGLINSRNYIGLNKSGRIETKKASEEIEKINFDLIICSPLRRTKQTCKIINKNNVKVIYDERIIERDSRSMQFKLASILDIDRWYDVNSDIVYKNSEGFKSIMDRTKELLDELKEKYLNKTILLVTHGDVCKAINAILNNIIDAKKINLSEQKNCEIRKYTIKL